MSHRSKIVAVAILVILPIGIALAQGGGGGWRECGGRRAVGAPRNNASVNSSAPPAASGSVASPNTATPTAPRRQPAALWRGHRWLYRYPTCRRTRLASDNRPIAPRRSCRMVSTALLPNGQARVTYRIGQNRRRWGIHDDRAGQTLQRFGPGNGRNDDERWNTEQAVMLGLAPRRL
jgi:hypothetical protein